MIETGLIVGVGSGVKEKESAKKVVVIDSKPTDLFVSVIMYR